MYVYVPTPYSDCNHYVLKHVLTKVKQYGIYMQYNSTIKGQISHLVQVWDQGYQESSRPVWSTLWDSVSKGHNNKINLKTCIIKSLWTAITYFHFRDKMTDMLHILEHLLFEEPKKRQT